MLVVNDLAVSIGSFAVEEVSFSIAEGEYFALLGSSGAGKTLILEAVAGLLEPHKGRITLDGEDITAAPAQERFVGYVHQDDTLFPHMTVAKNIAFGIRRMPKTERLIKIHELAEELGITPLLDRLPRTLSGGEAQRVALARALARAPRCLLLDEPLSALDVASRDELQTLLRRINRGGVSILHVTHDYDETLALAHRVGIMDRGRLVQVGTPQEVFEAPKTSFVARFVDVRNIIEGVLGPRLDPSSPRIFEARGIPFKVKSNREPGQAVLLLKSDSLIMSPHPPEDSALFTMDGVVTEIVSTRRGLLYTVDVGVPLRVEVARPLSMDGQNPANILNSKLWLSYDETSPSLVDQVIHPLTSL